MRSASTAYSPATNCRKPSYGKGYIYVVQIAGLRAAANIVSTASSLMAAGAFWNTRGMFRRAMTLTSGGLSLDGHLGAHNHDHRPHVDFPSGGFSEDLACAFCLEPGVAKVVRLVSIDHNHAVSHPHVLVRVVFGVEAVDPRWSNHNVVNVCAALTYRHRVENAPAVGSESLETPGDFSFTGGPLSPALVKCLSTHNLGNAR